MRGWSFSTQKLGERINLFPAHAGVILKHDQANKCFHAFSRTCGGDPSYISNTTSKHFFFPHMRGWSL